MHAKLYTRTQNSCSHCIKKTFHNLPKAFLNAHADDLAKAEANYQLTETPAIREHDLFRDCRPDEYEINYHYDFAAHLELPAFCNFQGDRALAVAFPREDQAVAKVINVDNGYEGVHICVTNDKFAFCDKYNADALCQTRSLWKLRPGW